MVTNLMSRVVYPVVLAAAGIAVHAQEVTLDAPDASDDLKRQLQNASLTISLEEQDGITAQDYVAAARADYRRLLTALYSAGFYGSEISIRVNGQEAADIAPLDAPVSVQSVAIQVSPGARFSFGTAEVTPLPDGAELPEDFASGLPARSDVVRASVASAVSSWRDIGYAKAAVSSQNLRANHPTATLDATIGIATGPRLSFGTVTVTGNTNVRTEAIKRIAGVPEGEVFSPQELDAAQQRLRRTGAFDTANAAEAEAIGPNDTLPVTLTVAESKPRRFGFGLELSTIDGLTVSSFWMHRNAFGGAERFRVDGEVSGIGGETGGRDYLLTSSLGIPAVYGPKTDLLGTFTLSLEDEPTYKIDKVSAEVQITRELREDLVGNTGIGILRAREETSDGVRRYTLVTLPLGLELDRRDDPTNTKDGYYIDVDATPFIGVQGIGNGARMFADARAYRSLGEDARLTLAARGMLGAVVGTDATDAPADFLFFSGGGGTVRGQSYKSLGIEEGGDLRGGTSFAGAQLEARYDLNDQVGLVGFYDFGHVGDSGTPLEDGDWHSGLGLGLRYNTGIGPIRLDVGTPANGNDAFESVQVYIGIGQAF